MLQLWIFLSIFGWICNGQAVVPPTTKPIWNATWTDTLKRDLLMTYDKFARPSLRQNTTNVRLGLTIRHIDIDEEKAIMTILGLISMVWKDDKLKWNSTDYGGLTSVHLADHEIWQPDILVYNSATGSSIDHYGNTHCIVKDSGEVIWVPPSQFQSFCDINLKLWPYDRQTCSLVLGSWTYDGNQIDLTFNKPGVETETLMENHQWAITNLSAERNVRLYSCCEEPYVDIRYNVTLDRRSPMFKAVVVTPASIIILMTLANFWLPAQAGEKILLNGINALIIVVFLVYFAQKLPTMAAHTPLVVLFYSCSLYLVSFSMILSVIVINLSRTKQARALPYCIKNALDGTLGTILGLKRINPQQNVQPRGEELRDQPFDEHVTSDDHQMIQSSSKGSIQPNWILLATAIDRIAFIIYCLIFTILAITYSV